MGRLVPLLVHRLYKWIDPALIPNSLQLPWCCSSFTPHSFIISFLPLSLFLCFYFAPSTCLFIILNIQLHCGVSFYVLCVSTLLSILTLVFIALLAYSYLLMITQGESKRLDIVSYLWNCLSYYSNGIVFGILWNCLRTWLCRMNNLLQCGLYLSSYSF